MQGHGATLLEVVRHHAAGLAAADLAPGAPCPVCGSTEHPHPHDTVDADALRAILEQYERTRHELATLQTQADEVRKRQETVLAEHDWDDAERPSRDQLETSLNDTRARREQAEGAKNRLTEIDGELHEITQERERQQTRLAEARTELARRRQHIENLDERIREVLNQLPEELHQPDAFHARLRERRARLDERNAALEAAKEAHATAATEQETAAATLKERDEVLSTARAHLEQAEADLRQRLHACGFAGEDELAAAAMDPGELQRRQEDLRTFDAELQKARTQVETLRQELADQAPPDLEALQAAKNEAQRAWEEADAALHRATQAATTLEATLEKLEAAEKAYERSRQRLEATQNLANLAGGRLTGRAKIDFETFVLQSIFGEVLAVGNAHLHRMTGGRYALHLVRDETRGSNRGLELEVADHHAGGGRRPAKTLSGGEGFLAALALALGLSECAQRYSGGVELGALFVDEGFGSLDEVALEKAVDILRHLPHAENRMVGVITHVAELKRRIPTQVLVEPQDVGSTITVRRNA
ncbi:MAG: SMC family ATPase [Trueperaceae bacterium]|nr:SMC family ATPase [Trueperaceae bacterium]